MIVVYHRDPLTQAARDDLAERYHAAAEHDGLFILDDGMRLEHVDPNAGYPIGFVSQEDEPPSLSLIAIAIIGGLIGTVTGIKALILSAQS